MLLGCLLLQGPLAPSAQAASHLQRFLKRVPAAEIFPGADRLGTPKGEPPVAEAFRGGELIGYVFLNADFVSAIGYSGKPIHVLLALDLEGVLVGAKLVEHHEPIVLIGIPEDEITAVIDGYLGLDIGEAARAAPGDRDIDIVSGATVTIMVIDDSILRAGIKVARRFGLAGLAPELAEQAGPRATVNLDLKTTEDWGTLLGDGSVRRLSLSVGDVNRAFEQSGNLVAAQRAEPGPEEDDFIDLHAALVSVPSLGLSLLGGGEYANLEKRLEPGQQAILLASRGRYSFKGSGYVRGGIFDRFQVIQGDNAYRFRDRDHKRLRRVMSEGAPDFADVDLFRIPKGQSLDPTKPWRVELLVSRETGPTDKAFLTFALDYRLPERFLLIEAAEAQAETASEAAANEPPPLWQTLWRDKAWQVVVLVVALAVLTLIFFLQTWLVHRPRLTDGIRLSFLVFTLFGLGFYANAQLSVVNIMTFFNAMISGFSWEYFLMEPLIFILWFSVAASLLFWGRGAFCGWLCPFGALQELTNRLAKLARGAADRRALVAARAALAVEVHDLPAAVRAVALFPGAGRAAGRDRALQDRDHPEVRPRVALPGLCPDRAGRRAVHRALLLPLPLSARCRPGDPGPAAHVRVAAPLPRMRRALPALRQGMHGAGDPSGGAHQSQRVPLLPALPDPLPGRPSLPGDDPAEVEARTSRRPGLQDLAGDGGCRQRTQEDAGRFHARLMAAAACPVSTCSEGDDGCQ